jgi:alpha-1,6-mannosyltransferase
MLICDFTQFYSPVSGGVRRYLHEKRRYLDKLKGEWRHLLIVPGQRTAFVRENERLCTFTIGAPRIDPKSRYRVLLNIPALRKALREHRPAVVECGDPYHATWAVLEESRNVNAGCVGFYHSHFPDAYLRTAAKYVGQWASDFILDYAKHYIQRLYNKLDLTLVPSPHLCDVLKGWGVRRARALTLGVDVEIFNHRPQERSLREELGIAAGRTFLLHVGRLSGEKNITTLLDAYGLLSREYPGKFHLHLVGDGPLRSEVRKAMSQTGSVTWQRYINDSEQLARLYNSADIFVHPGVCETFGLVSVEAQACGLPVCGIRGSFMDPIILKHLDLWALSNTAKDLAAAILRFENVRECINREELALEAAQKFSWDRVFANLLNFYKEVIA